MAAGPTPTRLVAVVAISSTVAACAQLAGVEPWAGRETAGGGAGGAGGLVASSSAVAGGAGGARVCGNGVVEGGEGCDDGNDTEDDGCDSNCQRSCDGPEEDVFVEDETTGHCYRLVTAEETDWFTGEEKCKQWFGHLVSITSAAEQDLVVALCAGGAHDPWIGASDRAEGKYLWVDREPFEYTAWADGQPNGRTIPDEDCVLLVQTSGLAWHDAPCAESRSWICERHTGIAP